MARYIDAEKVIEKISTITIKGGCTDAYEVGINKGLDIATEIINHTPTADVEPVRHGKWIKTTDPNTAYTCSRCDNWFLCDTDIDFNYCPNCGAKMDEED